MRIGIVANTAWNVANFRRNLLEAFREECHEVWIFAPTDAHAAKLIAAGAYFVHVPLQNKGANPIRDFYYAWSLYRKYRRHRLDVVLHFTVKPNIYGTLAARLAGIPCINNVTGLGTVFLHDNLKTSLAKWLYRFSFRFPKLIFFQNADDRALFAKERLLTSGVPTEVLPGSGVDTAYFAPQPRTAKARRFTFLMIARLLFDKGVREYVEAARKLKPMSEALSFQLLGTLETEAGLGLTAAQVAQWEADGLVEYLGTTDDVRPFIADADCVVLPSYREGTPRALLEAASMAKPLIATNVAGCKEVVAEGENGWLCALKDADDLAEKMTRMWVCSPAERDRMGQNSRVLAVQRFDHTLVTTAYQRAIARLETKVV